MLQLKNHSPFSPAMALFPNEQGVDTLYIMLKATFSYEIGVQLAEEQIPLQLEDEYWGESGQSSIKYLSEMHLGKPSTDIIVVGHAYSPKGESICEMDCGIRLGAYSKIIRVYGTRYWNGSSVTHPEPFTKMPLIFENAYGGAYLDTRPDEQDKEEVPILHEINPVGRGYYKSGKQSVSGNLLPNLEEPKQLISKKDDNPPPACFGFIAPICKPRVEYAGTYDEAWQKSRAPYLPKDFDRRFFSAAASELTCQEYLEGGESVMMVGLHPDGTKQFKLPICDINCKVEVSGRAEKPSFNLETVLFEPDKNQFSITFRASMSCDKETLKVREVHIHGSWNDPDKSRCQSTGEVSPV